MILAAGEGRPWACPALKHISIAGAGSVPLDVDAIILAGGKGTRLRVLHPDSQKVVLSVGGRPFLERIIDQLTRVGCRRIVFAVGYKSDQVKALLQDDGRNRPELVVSEEAVPLGTGGAVRLALEKTETAQVLVLNGDSYVQADLEAFHAFHLRRKARASVLLVRADSMRRFGAVETGPDGRISAFHEKNPDLSGPGYVNAGIYIFSRAFLEEIPVGVPMSLEVDLFQREVGDELYGMKQDVPFIDIGTPGSFSDADRFFEQLESEA